MKKTQRKIEKYLVTAESLDTDYPLDDEEKITIDNVLESFSDLFSDGGNCEVVETQWGKILIIVDGMRPEFYMLDDPYATHNCSPKSITRRLLSEALLHAGFKFIDLYKSGKDEEARKKIFEYIKPMIESFPEEWYRAFLEKHGLWKAHS